LHLKAFFGAFANRKPRLSENNNIDSNTRKRPIPCKMAQSKRVVTEND
jgi:hypothetical protein